MSDYIDESGLELRAQAKFTAALAKEVVGSDSFELASLQPSIKMRHNEAWTRALALAVTYLESFRMEITTETMAHEMDEDTIPRNTKFLKLELAADHIARIVRHHRRGMFTERVDVFQSEQRKTRPVGKARRRV